MQKVKFILLTALILLSGAALSGLAAWKVVIPAAGETVNAGVRPVPSVLGQTANEVLFYPWPVYDMQTLTPITEDEIEMYGIGDFSFSAIVTMEALGAEFDMEKLVKSQQISDGRRLAAGNSGLRYVKDFPAMLGDVPVLLNYAQSGNNPSAVSWLMRPAEEMELSEARQQEALDKVRDDLAGLIWYDLIEQNRNYGNDLTAFLESFNTLQESGWMFYEWLKNWIELMAVQYNGSYDMAFMERQGLITVQYGGQAETELWQEPSPYSLEEVLGTGQGGLVDVQFISTPRQIVLLFNLESGINIGVYYDIQLGCYSGLGLSG